ncbi:MAG: endonuclease/exonuclease/phosphatase family protein [Saprospiraceae bacterium]|nr:endonuclease/exonuclease/phosphatase family protein [Saprospiraceae bacterium]
MKKIFSKNYPFYVLILFWLLQSGCEPLVDTIPEIRDCETYTKQNAQTVPAKDTVLVMTWNIRFGCGVDILWFGDACGDRTVLLKKETEKSLESIIARINQLKPDILLLQEVDLYSKRSAYIDQMKYIMDRTYFGYGYYGTNWKSQFIPSDGIGRLDEGNAILSVWPMTEGTLYPLPLRTDVDALTKYFYVRESVLSGLVTMPDGKSFYAINTHLSAYSTDDTKLRQLQRYIAICDSLSKTGIAMVTGGDYNLIPPNSDITDYCLADACPGEKFHESGVEKFHKEGSYFTPEINWMNAMYERYESSLPLSEYKLNQKKYYSHSSDPNIDWNRTLDYLFTNRAFIKNSHKTWQEFRKEADHAAVTALLTIKK